MHLWKLETIFTFSIQRGLADFKAKLTEKYPDIHVNLFQKENRLHLTIGMLYLLGSAEVARASKLLDKCRDRLNNLLGDYEVSEAAFDIQGIEIMNDDPYMTDVVYAKVQDPDELLQEKWRHNW